MKQDLQIASLIKKEFERQSEGIELIASENFVSNQVLEALGSVLTNKYAEGYPAARYYGGCEVVDQVEQLAIDRLCKLFDAEFANVQPHSGAQANMAVMMTCIKPGDTFMGLDLAHGGHLTHGSPVNVSGMLYNAVSYHLNEETGLVDYDEMERVARESKPKLIIGGASAYSREWDWERMRAIADEVGAILWVDMAHPAGLIAAHLLKNPVKYLYIESGACRQTPIERMINRTALIPYAIPDLRTQIEEPPAYLAAEIEVHQDRQLDVMQIVVGVSDRLVAMRPSAVHVVQLHLEMTVFMPCKAEHQPCISA